MLIQYVMESQTGMVSTESQQQISMLSLSTPCGMKLVTSQGSSFDVGSPLLLVGLQSSRVLAILVDVKQQLIVILICSISLMTNNVQACFYLIFGHLYISFRDLYSNSLSIFQLGYLSFYHQVARVLCIFQTQVPYSFSHNLVENHVWQESAQGRPCSQNDGVIRQERASIRNNQTCGEKTQPGF